MSFSLRRRNLACFYCGSRSAQRQKAKLRQWKCEHCDAVNHLDENGEISDPPPAPSRQSASLRFAHIPDRAVSPSRSSAENIFCETCLKNQHIVKESLATYLPAEDSPRYAEFLSSYGSYRAKLEQRYPQVCARCAPKVRERIKQSAKEAQADHLRRLMDQTRQNAARRKTKREITTSFALALGGFAWYASAIFQVCWHLVMAWNIDWRHQEFTTLNESSISANLHNCVIQTVSSRYWPSGCLNVLQDWEITAICVSMLFSWWNNKLRERYLRMRGSGKFIGLERYYMLQFLIQVVRIVFMRSWLHGDMQNMEKDSLDRRHMAMIALNLASILLALRGVEIRTKPRISFHVGDELLPQVPSGNDPDASATPERLRRGPATPNAQRGFDISKLATTNPNSTQKRNQKSIQITSNTTFADQDYADDPDAMEWTPVTKSPQFNPPPRPQPSPALNQPSPFHGTLPPAPVAPSHRLRRPASQQPGAFIPATDQQRENFFASVIGRRRGPASVASTTTTDIDVGTEDGELTEVEDDGREKARATNEMRVAPPRFFPRQDALDTGLEAMFDEVFNIKDDEADDGDVGQARSGEHMDEQGPGMEDDEDASGDRPSVLKSILGVLLIGAIPLTMFSGAGGLSQALNF